MNGLVTSGWLPSFYFQEGSWCTGSNHEAFAMEKHKNVCKKAVCVHKSDWDSEREKAVCCLVWVHLLQIFSVGWRASMQIRQKKTEQKVFRKEKERWQQSLNRGKAVRQQVPFSARYGWLSWDAESSFDCLTYNFTEKTPLPPPWEVVTDSLAQQDIVFHVILFSLPYGHRKELNKSWPADA